MSYCPSFKGVLVSVDGKNRKMATVARCKSWYCPYCAKLNRQRWQAVLLDYINKSDQSEWGWFTLTAHRNSHRSFNPGKYTLMNISRAWDRLMKRMKRKYGKFQYCRVYEKHKSGAYHLHCIVSFHWDDILWRANGSSRVRDSVWLRNAATSLGMGYKTHADNVETDKTGIVAFYVTKYMTKLVDIDQEEWGRVRRIQTSRGIKYNNTEKSEFDWVLKAGLWYEDFLETITKPELAIYLINEKRGLIDEDFEDGFVWPP